MVVNDSSRLKEARTFPQILSEANARPVTTNSFTLSSFNAVPMETVIDHKKMNFLGQLFNLSCSYIAKRVFNIRLTSFQHLDNQSLVFIPDINRILNKYALHHELDRYLSDGVFHSWCAWKRIIYVVTLNF